ncbi:MAG: DUF1868 domain-containing protein [Pseudomonadota bacterium]
MSDATPPSATEPAAIDLAGAEAALAGAPPRFLDVRFDAARRPVRCSGCTVVAHLEPEDRAPFAAVRAALEAAGAAEPWAWLPPASFHMTLFDLLLHDRRGPGFWPAALAPDASEAEVDAFAFDRLRAAGSAEAPPWRMRVEGLAVNALTAGCVSTRLVPVDAAETARIRGQRDRWAESLGLRGRPGHDAYVFHVTLAYMVRWPDPETRAAAEAALSDASARLTAEAPTLTLRRSDACTFEDMTAFHPRFATTDL